jgi:Secretion system C-terminal sorting domain
VVTGGTGPYTYAWSNSSNATTASTPNYNIPITTVPTTVTLLVTTSQGCTSSASTTITSLNASPLVCECGNLGNPSVFLTLTNGNNNDLCLAAGVPLGTVLFANYNIILKGTFTMTGPLIFDKCAIKMAKDMVGGVNQTVINTNQYDLTFRNTTTVSGCDQMWRGIIAAPVSATGLTHTITVNNSWIMDMLEGVQLHNQFRVNATNYAAFINNQYSLIFTDVSTGGYGANIMKKTMFGLSGSYTGLPPVGMLPPMVGAIPKNGITAINTKNLLIGDATAPTEGCSFTQMENGITVGYGKVINQLSSNSTVAFLNPAEIRVFNCGFKDIIGGIDVWDPTLYPYGSGLFDVPKGVAVFCSNGFALNHVGINVKNTLAAAGTTSAITFTNCNKALISTGMHTRFIGNSSIETNAGALVARCNGRFFFANNNDLSNVVLGIYKAGSHAYKNNVFMFDVNTNRISLKNAPVPAFGPQFRSTAITGISTVAGNTGTVYNNVIDIPVPTKAVGIRLYNSNKHYIQKNQIRFMAPAGSTTFTTVGFMPRLIGVELNRSTGCQYSDNKVTGSGSLSQNENLDACGLYLIRSGGADISCNTHDYLRYGTFVVGPNLTGNYAKVRGNRMHSHQANMYFAALAGEGDLGDIGDQLSAYDGSNQWLGDAGTSGVGLARLYRFANTSCTSPLGKVVTKAALLDAADLMTSKTNLPLNTCPIAVVNSQNLTDHACGSLPSLSTPSLMPPWPGNGTGTTTSQTSDEMNLARAAAITADATQYSEFTIGAKRFDELSLTRWLREQTLIRAQYPVLNAYYLDRQADAANLLSLWDDAYLTVLDSLPGWDSTQLDSALQQLQALNNELDDTEYFVAQDKFMNKVLMQLVANEAELEEADWQMIENLALTCPYLAGNATYKARGVLSAMLPNYTYNDRIICNSQGVYKTNHSSNNANSAILLELEALALQGQAMPVLVYPNPAQSSISIACNITDASMQATASIMDATGKTVGTYALNNQQLVNTLNIQHLPSGLYAVRVIIGNRHHHITKIIKQ